VSSGTDFLLWAEEYGVSRPLITTRPIEVTDTGHLIEFLFDDGSNDEILLCAGHGGAVEPGTAEAAIELTTALSATTCWATLGFEGDGSAFERWHPPSKEIDPETYPLLGRIADREFQTVCSLHGLADDAVIVGGAIDQQLKQRVAATLDDVLSVPVSVATDSAYAGTHPENFVNWLAGDDRGLQLELGPTARSEEAAALREAVVSLLRSDEL